MREEEGRQKKVLYSLFTAISLTFDDKRVNDEDTQNESVICNTF